MMQLRQRGLSQTPRCQGWIHPCTIRGRRPLEAVCFSRRGPRRAVERAVRRVNLWLKRNEELGEGTQITPEEDVITEAPAPYPMVHLRVRTRCSRQLQENASPGSTLRSYLSLPVSEYNLLDPQWVQLAPNKGSTFRVTVPVNELLNIDIGPVVADVKVRQDHLRSNVTLLIEGVTFGKPDLDKKLSIRVRLVLYASGHRRNWIRFKRRPSPVVDTFLEDFQDLQRIRSAGVPLPDLETGDTGDETETASADKDPMTLESYDTIELVETQATDPTSTDDRSLMMTEQPQRDLIKVEAEDRSIRLNCAVQLRLHVAIPQVLAIVPRVIIRSAGRIILRHTLNNAVPNFLNLIVDDYHAWATGAPRGFKRNGLFRKNEERDVDANENQINNM